MTEPDDDTAPLPTDIDELRALLRVRLIPESELAAAPVPTVHRVVLPHVAALLVLDLPDRLVVVTPERATELADGETRDELWELAEQQVRDHDHPDIDVEEPADGVPIMVLSSPSYFGATHVLWADRFLDAPPDGLLLAVPHRHLVLVHGVRDAGAQVALPNLALLARHHHDQGEGPVSPWLYWWHDETYHRIEVAMNADGTELSLGIPEALQEALNRLH